MVTTEQRLPEAKHEVYDVVFAIANTDTVVGHGLTPRSPGDVRYVVVDASVGGVVYRGSKIPQANYIVLKATVVGTYRIRLFLEVGLTQ